ncbi:glycoside hydrolase family 32 protein [Neobacillus sp. LXY-1]|uniref:glycoside hydrolase family 32 protein n=1 Tax=Neobacillus sp. LXY-1 TaxID=3379133 RepID=UPI003EE0CCDD
MEWTKERRYTRLHEVEQEEIAELSKTVNESPWRQSYHIQPVTGLLNDPNGFSFFNGEYHLFYQWFPLGPVHGLKYWYHTKSRDLVHWENIGIAIEPKDYFDSHGAYSGSAIEHNGELHLMYTGNTRDENWERHPYQCVAVMDRNGMISKREKPVISTLPKGYTAHFRDPKVWKFGETFYAVIGAQRINETGCVLLYSSPNMSDWKWEGEIKTGLTSFGYMWECPDYFEWQEKGVLIFSPQGLPPKGDEYHNIYQSGYILGEKLNFEDRSLIHGDFKELDRGFDFYAPQTMLDSMGRRILIGWMGLPELVYPTDRYGWAHCLTLPREITIQGDQLLQKPVQELALLRSEKVEAKVNIDNNTVEVAGFCGETYELMAEFTEPSALMFGVELRVGEKEKTIIYYDQTSNKVIFDRTYSGEPFATQYGTVRKCHLNASALKLHIFVDVSSVEVFVNDGAEVFTARIFPKKDSTGIRFFAQDGQVNLRATKWTIDKR